MTWQATGDAALKQVLSLFNHRPVWRQAKAPHATATLKAHVRTFTGDESEMVNAYGETGAAIYIDPATVPITPEKFDKVTLNDMVYTIGAVHPMYGFNNSLLYYMCYARGVGG